jgi:hypothetical protein
MQRCSLSRTLVMQEHAHPAWSPAPPVTDELLAHKETFVCKIKKKQSEILQLQRHKAS